MKGLTFVSVEFPNDPAVCGNTYWYLCEIPGADIGVKVFAPYPVGRIKKIEAIEASQSI